MRPARVSNYILICAHCKIRIAEARIGFKTANRESFPYIMHIVDEPRKFSPSNVLTYTVQGIFYEAGHLMISSARYIVLIFDVQHHILKY